MLTCHTNRSLLILRKHISFENVTQEHHNYFSVNLHFVLKTYRPVQQTSLSTVSPTPSHAASRVHQPKARRILCTVLLNVYTTQTFMKEITGSLSNGEELKQASSNCTLPNIHFPPEQSVDGWRVHDRLMEEDGWRGRGQLAPPPPPTNSKGHFDRPFTIPILHAPHPPPPPLFVSY